MLPNTTSSLLEVSARELTGKTGSFGYMVRKSTQRTAPCTAPCTVEAGSIGCSVPTRLNAAVYCCLRVLHRALPMLSRRVCPGMELCSRSAAPLLLTACFPAPLHAPQHHRMSHSTTACPTAVLHCAAELPLCCITAPSTPVVVQAPEVARSQDYNAQADIFSLGMCM